MTAWFGLVRPGKSLTVWGEMAQGGTICRWRTGSARYVYGGADRGGLSLTSWLGQVCHLRPGMVRFVWVG